MRGEAVGGWFNGRPWRNPERVHSSGFVEDLGDVSAFMRDGDAQAIVLDQRRAPAAETGFGHKNQAYYPTPGPLARPAAFPYIYVVYDTSYTTNRCQCRPM